MLSKPALTVSLAAAAGVLARPTNELRDTSADAIVSKWQALLANDKSQLSILAANYQESSAGLFELNALCPQSLVMYPETAGVYNTTIISNAREYEASMSSRNKLNLHDWTTTASETSIGVKASLSVPNDSASVGAIAIVDLTVDGKQISAIHWEFDAQATFARLRDTKQCTTLKIASTGATAIGHLARDAMEDSE